jgi:hypothetical protein
MACETGKWESILPNNATEIDDGSVFIDELDGSGNIKKGRYRPKDANPGQDEDFQAGGTCKNNEIQFDIVGFHYEGKIKGRIIKGKKKTRQTNMKEFDGEEVWVGVKTA